jgi:hypothetical protein
MTPIPLEIRSRADAVVIAANHLRALLPASIPPADAPTADAIAALHDNPAALQVWLAWSAVVRFAWVWNALVVENMPAQGERARTMESAPTEKAS